jgi:hypothetical protein
MHLDEESEGWAARHKAWKVGSTSKLRSTVKAGVTDEINQERKGRKGLHLSLVGARSSARRMASRPSAF